MTPRTLPSTLPRFLWYFISKQPLSFLVFLTAPSAIVLKTNVTPYVMKLVIDTLSDKSMHPTLVFDELAIPMWVGSISWLGLIAIERFNSFIQSKALPIFEGNMRMEVVQFALSHSYEFFNNHMTGSISNKVTVLIRAINEIRKIITVNLIPAASVMFVSLILMYTVKPIFSLIIFLWVFLQILVIIYLSRRVNDTSTENAIHKSNISGLIVDIMSNIASVKLFAREDYELSNLQRQQITEMQSHSNLISKMNWVCTSVDFFVTLVLGSTFYFLVKGWQDGEVTVGDLVFVVYMVFAIMNQTWLMGYALADFFKEIGVSKDSLSLIAKKPSVIDEPNAKPIQISHGKIELKKVYFSYLPEKPVFENLNVTIYPGQKIGIVGYSGSGKSSFVNLILRFYDICSGYILIDGQDISKVQQKSLRRKISVILQDTTLFNRSLIENIRYGYINATNAEVLAATKNSRCDEFISSALPDGYETTVGERGTKLSGGQRQRVSIARCMLKEAPIIILDEATSALDTETEDIVQQNFDKLMSGKTAIVIAHRLSTLMRMDRIIVFSNGKIVEDGKHKELITSKGIYSNLLAKQSNGFLPS